MSDTHSWTPRPQTWEVPVTPLLTSKEYVDALIAENDRLRRTLRLTESVLVLVPEIDPVLLAQVRAALAKEAGK